MPNSEVTVSPAGSATVNGSVIRASVGAGLTSSPSFKQMQEYTVLNGAHTRRGTGSKTHKNLFSSYPSSGDYATSADQTLGVCLAVTGITQGSDILTVPDTTGLSANDPFLISDTQGLGDNTGNSQFGFIVAIVDATTVQIDKPVFKTYDAATHKIQFVSAPMYDTLTVNNIVTPQRSWNGTTGGIILVVARKLIVETAGQISANNAGFRGASRRDPTGHGYRGEGQTGAGLNSYGGTSPTAGSGQGGSGYYRSQTSGDIGWSGSGAGYGARGVNSGAHPNYGGYYSYGGNIYGQANLEREIHLGSGGGGGAGDKDTNSGYGGAGGRGGGMVFVVANEVIVRGSICANGQQGGRAYDYGNGEPGNGGGGSGGSVFIKCNRIDKMGTVTSLAGPLRSGYGGYTSGAGGKGRTLIRQFEYGEVKGKDTIS